jgi:hypothetical protein
MSSQATIEPTDSTSPPHETTSESDLRTAAARIPAELRMQILSEYLKLPNGIHSDRFPSIKKVRVDKLLSIPSLAEIVPETLYRNKKLIIKAEPGYDGKYDTRILYPQASQTDYVRDLEFQFRLDKGCDHRRLRSLMQLEWLRKLAAGELGFRNLDSFRITIVKFLKCDSENLVSCLLGDLIHKDLWTGTETFGFKCKSFELVLPEHGCAGNGGQCRHSVELLKYFGN